MNNFYTEGKVLRWMSLFKRTYNSTSIEADDIHYVAINILARAKLSMLSIKIEDNFEEI